MGWGGRRGGSGAGLAQGPRWRPLGAVGRAAGPLPGRVWRRGSLRMVHGWACPPGLPKCPPGGVHTLGRQAGRPGRRSRGSRGSPGPRSLPGALVHQTPVTLGAGPSLQGAPSHRSSQHSGQPVFSRAEPQLSPHPLMPGAPRLRTKPPVAPCGLAEGRLPPGCAQGLPAPGSRHSALSEVHETPRGARRRRRVQGCGGSCKGPADPEQVPDPQSRRSSPDLPRVRAPVQLPGEVGRPPRQQGCPRRGCPLTRPLSWHRTKSPCPGEPCPVPGRPSPCQGRQDAPEGRGLLVGQALGRQRGSERPVPAAAAEAQSGPGPALTLPARWSSTAAAQSRLPSQEMGRGRGSWAAPA